MELVEYVYKLTEKLPTKEQFGLIAQMRRAAVSIPSNIAEGYGRHSTASYIHFLSIARGSLLELETQIELCIRIKFLAQTDIESAAGLMLEISKMLSVLISKLRK